MEYRKDIDGLRAIAVLAVILFHGKFAGFDGGYIGVDIFFAISGFLITSIIYPQILNSTFSMSEFYKRRARRLLPASLLMVVIITLCFSTIYPSDLYEKVANSAVASVFFFANIFFWQSSGYFSPSLELQPLLHMWSLSLEEQFYFVFPIFLIICAAKLKKYILQIVLFGCIVSLALAVYYAPNSLSFFSFYILPTRFYELGLGASLAIFLHHKKNNFSNQSWFRKLGIVLILASIIFYDSSLAFPSFYPLLPVIGTLLLLSDNSKDGNIYRILTNPLLVKVGLYSYSLYLWHWPIHVYLSWQFEGLETLEFNAIYLSLTLVFGIASYYFVEMPLRKPITYKPLSQKVILTLSGVVAICIPAALAFNGNNNLIQKPQLQLFKYEQALIFEPFRDSCTDHKRLKGTYSICTLKAPKKAEYTVLLWGDSHASSLMSAANVFSDRFKVRAFNTSGCPSLVSVMRTNDDDCKAHNDYMVEYLKQNHHLYDLVIHASAWQNYLDLKLLKHPEAEDSTASLQKGFNSTQLLYRELSLPYLIVHQFPKHKVHVPMHYFKHDEPEITLKSDDYIAKLDAIEKLVPGIEFTRFNDLMCTEKYCRANDSKMLFYRDSHHISKPFGEKLSPYLEQAMLKKIEQFENTR